MTRFRKILLSALLSIILPNYFIILTNCFIFIIYFIISTSSLLYHTYFLLILTNHYFFYIVNYYLYFYALYYNLFLLSLLILLLSATIICFWAKVRNLSHRVATSCSPKLFMYFSEGWGTSTRTFDLGVLLHYFSLPQLSAIIHIYIIYN